MARKYTKKSDYWKSKSPQETVTKAAPSIDKDTQQAALSMSLEIGTIGLNSIKAFSRFLQPYDLRFPECIRTYKEMGDDPDVATALDATYIFVDRAFFDFSIEHNASSANSRKAAKFLDFSFRNMEAPLRHYIRSLMSYKQFGFALAEKVYEKDEDINSPYFGYYRLKKLAFRPQDTLDLCNPFTYSDDGREILQVNQNITDQMVQGVYSATPLGFRSIPMNKIMHVGNNITQGNPFGVSPLQAVYRSWREKSLIQEFEVVGVSKDLGGMPVLEVPSTILNRANLDPDGDEARSLRILQSEIANLHAGEQSYMVLPSDVYDATSMRQYALTFQGVSGNGKQFDTSALINQRKKEIYDRFGAGVLIMDGENGGSFAMSDNKQTLLSRFIERDIDIIIEAINQMIPQMLSLNGFIMAPQDMPRFVSADMGDPDIGTNSSAIQRVVASAAIPVTPQVINEFYGMLGIKYRIPDEIVGDPEAFLEFMTNYGGKSTTRSGDGLATGTNTTSTSVSALDPSVSNLSNG